MHSVYRWKLLFNDGPIDCDWNLRSRCVFSFVLSIMYELLDWKLWSINGFDRLLALHCR